MTKGGAAKGELVLAIFELANCFRYAWGVKKDPIAARQYYETAANLGDTDALEEAAWCYLEGFGGPKDKVSSGPALLLFVHCIFSPLVIMAVSPIPSNQRDSGSLARSAGFLLSLLTHCTASWAAMRHQPCQRAYLQQQPA
jgi:TPR repeat protein